MGKKITVIQFSTRKNGNCAAVLDHLCGYYAGETVFGYAVNMEPCGNCNYECLRKGEKCPNITQTQVEIMDSICSSDMVYFIVPNFCGYPCAGYFAFNERSVGYFDMDSKLLQKYMGVPKRFIIISNSESNQFADAMQQQVIGEPEIFYLKTGKYGCQSIAGDLMDSEEAKADLNRFLDLAGMRTDIIS